MREQLQYLLMLDRVPGTEIIFAPSGTDAELIIAHLGLRDGPNDLLNIVVGPQEVGSGTESAAGGLYFDTHVPSGGCRAAHSPLPGHLSERIDVVTVGLRDAEGTMRAHADLDAAVTAATHEGLASNRNVLIHIVAHSKTGVHAPKIATARQLYNAAPERVMVVVDAAQGRISRRGLVEALRSGFIVLLTGSKFFGGPPFSGAVLVPPEHARAAKSSRLPEGFADFFTRSEWPADWLARERLPTSVNVGLLLRWTAAIAEIQAYYACPGTSRYAVLRAFEQDAPRALSSAECVELLTVYPPVEADDRERLLESKTTVYGFKVRRLDRPDRPLLGRDELKRVARWLNQDLSDVPDVPNPESLAIMVHLGQPVALGSSGEAALRLALGGPLIESIAVGPDRGETLDRRLEWMRDSLEALARKLDSISRAYRTLIAAEEP